MRCCHRDRAVCTYCKCRIRFIVANTHFARVFECPITITHWRDRSRSPQLLRSKRRGVQMASNSVLLIEGCSESEFGWIARAAGETAETSILILEIHRQEVANLMFRKWSLEAANGDNLVLFHIGIGKINGFSALTALMQISASIRPIVSLLWRNDSVRLDGFSNSRVDQSHSMLRHRLEAAGFSWIALDEMMQSRTGRA